MNEIKFYTTGVSTKRLKPNRIYSPFSNYFPYKDDNKKKRIYYPYEDKKYKYNNTSAKDFFLENPQKGKGMFKVDEEEWWQTSEAYFQAMKFDSPSSGKEELRKKYMKLIRLQNDPQAAKSLGDIGKKTYAKNAKNSKAGISGTAWKIKANKFTKLNKNTVDSVNEEFLNKIKLRDDWEQVKIQIMIDALIYKFTQNPNLKKLLTDVPDDTYIIEHVRRDKVWGDGGDGSGSNYLGKILTALSYVFKHKKCDSNFKKIFKRVSKRIRKPKVIESKKTKNR